MSAIEIPLLYRGVKNLGNITLVCEAGIKHAEITDEQIRQICDSIWGLNKEG